MLNFQGDVDANVDVKYEHTFSVIASLDTINFNGDGKANAAQVIKTSTPNKRGI